MALIMQNYIKDSFQKAAAILEKFSSHEENITLISEAVRIMASSLKNGGKILSCGNGGSMCDSMHFAEELTGRFYKNRPPIAAIAISDPSHLTCTGNDYGIEQVFSRYVEGLGRPGDILLAISTSGNSPNIVSATQMAKEKGIKVVALLGKDGGKMKSMADIALVVNHDRSERIQEVHIKIIHIMVEEIERSLFPS